MCRFAHELDNSGGTRMEAPDSFALETHLLLTEAERSVLELLAAGEPDTRIVEILDLSVSSLRSRMDRLSARTGLSGRRRVAWSVTHVDCCVRKHLPCEGAPGF